MLKESGIVADGQGRYLEALSQQESKEVGELKVQLAAEKVSARRAQLEEEIRQVRQRYKQLRRNAAHSLF